MAWGSLTSRPNLGLSGSKAPGLFTAGQDAIRAKRDMNLEGIDAAVNTRPALPLERGPVRDRAKEARNIAAMAGNSASAMIALRNQDDARDRLDQDAAQKADELAYKRDELESYKLGLGYDKLNATNQLGQDRLDNQANIAGMNNGVKYRIATMADGTKRLIAEQNNQTRLDITGQNNDTRIGIADAGNTLKTDQFNAKGQFGADKFNAANPDATQITPQTVNAPTIQSQGQRSALPTANPVQSEYPEDTPDPSQADALPVAAPAMSAAPPKDPVRKALPVPAPAVDNRPMYGPPIPKEMETPEIRAARAAEAYTRYWERQPVRPEMVQYLANQQAQSGPVDPIQSIDPSQYSNHGATPQARPDLPMATEKPAPMYSSGPIPIERSGMPNIAAPLQGYVPQPEPQRPMPAAPDTRPTLGPPVAPKAVAKDSGLLPDKAELAYQNDQPTTQFSPEQQAQLLEKMRGQYAQMRPEDLRGFKTPGNAWPETANAGAWSANTGQLPITQPGMDQERAMLAYDKSAPFPQMGEDVADNVLQGWEAGRKVVQERPALAQAETTPYDRFKTNPTPTPGLQPGWGGGAERAKILSAPGVMDKINAEVDADTSAPPMRSDYGFQPSGESADWMKLRDAWENSNVLDRANAWWMDNMSNTAPQQIGIPEAPYRMTLEPNAAPAMTPDAQKAIDWAKQKIASGTPEERQSAAEVLRRYKIS